MTALSVEPVAVLSPGVQLSCARFSPCGNFLLAPAHDATVRRWDLAADLRAELPHVAGHRAWATDIAFLPDKKHAVSSDSWGQLRAWPYADENPAALWVRENAHDGWIRALAISPDGQTLASCGRDQKILLTEPSTGKPIRELPGHTEDIFALTFHPSGNWLLSGDLKGRIIQWESASGKNVREFQAPDLYLYDRIQDVGGVRRLTFSPDGNTLAAAGAKPSTGNFVKGHALAYLFDFNSGESTHRFHLGKQDADVFAHDILFHPTGALLAATSGQPGQGSLIAHRPGQPGPDLVHTKDLTNCHSLSLHPDGTTLAISSTNPASNGNGRRLVDGKYPTNHSPIHLLSLTAPSPDSPPAP